LTRHREHVEPTTRRLGIVPSGPPEPDRVDPLGGALELLAAAKTERQRLRALEAVRAGSWLLLKQAGDDPDVELLERLDVNIAQAEAMFRDVQGFETSLYALAGVREAVNQRIRAAGAPETVETSYSLSFVGPDGRVVPGPPGKPFRMSAKQYFADVPARFHDPERFRVERTIHLEWNGPGRQDLKVRDVGSDALVWSKDVTNA
jgi:hypothetical protein